MPAKRGEAKAARARAEVSAAEARSLREQLTREQARADEHGTPLGRRGMRGDTEVARRTGAALPGPSGLTDAEEELGRKGYPIQAVNSIRKRTGKGLREAKEQYDAANIPSL